MFNQGHAALLDKNHIILMVELEVAQNRDKIPFKQEGDNFAVKRLPIEFANGFEFDINGESSVKH